MLPLIDTHVHLFAGRDDGPQSADEALAMCRMLAAEGARGAAALAHQNDYYPDNTPDALRAACGDLAAAVAAAGLPLAVYPTGEVMASADLPARVAAGQCLTVADRGQFVLVEQPHGAFLDLMPLAVQLRLKNVRIIVAHAERYPEILHDDAAAARLIGLGCLIQITARAFATAPTADAKQLRTWATRGFIHLLGSDGHGLDRRPPRLKEGYLALAAMAGGPAADRIGHIWASAVMDGRPVNPPPPAKPTKGFFGRLFGN